MAAEAVSRQCTCKSRAFKCFSASTAQRQEKKTLKKCAKPSLTPSPHLSHSPKAQSVPWPPQKAGRWAESCPAIGSSGVDCTPPVKTWTSALSRGNIDMACLTGWVPTRRETTRLGTAWIHSEAVAPQGMSESIHSAKAAAVASEFNCSARRAKSSWSSGSMVRRARRDAKKGGSSSSSRSTRPRWRAWTHFERTRTQKRTRTLCACVRFAFGVEFRVEPCFHNVCLHVSCSVQIFD